MGARFATGGGVPAIAVPECHDLAQQTQPFDKRGVKISAIVINGSPKKRGRVAKLCQRFGVRVVHLADGIEQAYEEIKKADVIIFATPVLWFNVNLFFRLLQLAGRIAEKSIGTLNKFCRPYFSRRKIPRIGAVR